MEEADQLKGQLDSQQAVSVGPQVLEGHGSGFGAGEFQLAHGGDTVNDYDFGRIGNFSGGEPGGCLPTGY